MSQSTGIDDGGPAFPQGHLDGPHVNPSGMSLLDYFAAKAMVGIIAGDPERWLTPAAISDMAYTQAIAMMLARKRI